MKSWIVGLAVFVALSASARPSLDRQIIGSEQDHSAEANDCDHFYKTTFTSFRSQVNEQEQTEFPVDVKQLRVTAQHEGGVSIRGWTKPFARLIVCRYAVANNRSQALRVLDAINISHANGEVIAYGPPINDTQAWWVNMILYLPRRAEVDVQAGSGGVAIRNMNGRVTAHATSGGVSVAQSSGRYKITTESGGITIDRIDGTVDASSKEGAIALKLEAKTHPSIDAQTADAGHISCALKLCADANWDVDRRRLRMGSGVPDFRLVTMGAGITIGAVTN